MPEKITIEKFKEAKLKRELFNCVQSNVYPVGSVESMAVYSNYNFKFLMQILYFLPDEIAVDVLNSCYFIFPMRDHGMYIPAAYVSDRDVIVFNSFNDVSEEMIFRIMLHEIGHSYLKHRGSHKTKGREKREIEATEWAEQMMKLVY